MAVITNADDNGLNALTVSITGGAPAVYFKINSTLKFAIEYENTPIYKITGPGGTTDDIVLFDRSDNNTIEMPKTAAYMTYNSTTSYTNISGDNTVYTVPEPTEIFDQNNDYSSPNFTAPVTGKYLLGNVDIFFNNYSHTSTNYIDMYVVTSNRSYQCLAVPGRGRVTGMYGGNGWIMLNFTVLADMDAGDTAYFTYTGYGSSKLDDIMRTGTFGVLIA